MWYLRSAGQATLVTKIFLFTNQSLEVNQSQPPSFHFEDLILLQI